MIDADPQEKKAPSSGGLGRTRPWEFGAAVLIACLVVFNEVLPLIFGTGERALWDWAFTYVTLRAILIPGISLAVLASSILRLPSSRGRTAWIRVGSAVVAGGAIYASWIYQMPLFSR